MNADSNPSVCGPSFGVVLVAIGLLASLLASGLEYHPLGDNRDPGPRAFPIGLGVCLLAGGAVELAQWARRRTKARHSDSHDAVSWFASARSAVTHPRNRDAWLLVVGLAIYVPAIFWVGFASGTLLFAGATMWRLGTRWWMAGAMSLLLVVVIQLLFGTLFHVQLPAGRLSLPF